LAQVPMIMKLVLSLQALHRTILLNFHRSSITHLPISTPIATTTNQAASIAILITLAPNALNLGSWSSTRKMTTFLMIPYKELWALDVLLLTNNALLVLVIH
jgi:hypothetical protein